MRIAMLQADLPEFGQGGVPRQVSDLANVLVSRGHEVVVHALTPGPPHASYEIRQLRKLRALPGGRLGRYFAPAFAFSAASYEGFDVIHAHGDSFLLRARDAPVVRTFHGSARQEAIHATGTLRTVSQHAMHYGERAAVRLATFTVGVSRNTVRTLGKLDAVVPCGVDRTRFFPGPKTSHPTVLFVGTLGGRKRGRLLLRAFDDYVRPQIPSSELWFVADSSVELPGVRSYRNVSDGLLARLFREAWVYVSTSSYEGFGVPYIEAMASGTPIATTRNAGACELLESDEAGLVVEDRDLPHTIVSLLRDSARQARLGRNGIASSSKYDWLRVAALYEQIYDRAIARWSQGKPATLPRRR